MLGSYIYLARILLLRLCLVFYYYTKIDLKFMHAHKHKLQALFKGVDMGFQFLEGALYN